MTLLLLAGLGLLPARVSAAEIDELDPREGSIGIQLLEAPLNRRNDPRALRYIVDHLSPGAVIQRQVLVVNKSSDRQHIEIYPAAATVDNERFQFGAGHAANELTSWISLDQDHIDVDAGGEAHIKATINVPPAASIGERYAVIWASVSSRPDPSANVNSVHRVGVRVYLDIGTGGEPPSEFTIGELVPARDSNGEPSIAIQVKNTGGRALDISGSVTLTDGPGGMHAGPFDVVRGTTLAAGDAGTATVRFPRELPNGPWKIQINLESGLVKHTATGEISFPDPDQVGQSTSLFSGRRRPAAIAGAVLLAGLAIAGGVAYRARRTRSPY